MLPLLRAFTTSSSARRIIAIVRAPRILIVEDDPKTSASIGMYLRHRESAERRQGRILSS